MKPEPVPSAIVSRLLESAKELEEWADTHRTASLAEHEQGVLEIFRRCMGPALGGVLERALDSISRRLDACARRVPSAARAAARISGEFGVR